MSTTKSKTIKSNTDQKSAEGSREHRNVRDTYYVDYDNGMRVSMTKKEYEKYFVVKKRLMTRFLAELQDKKLRVKKSLKKRKYKVKSCKKRSNKIYIDESPSPSDRLNDEITKKMSVVALADNCESSGGWIRDLTEEGVEPNPGPNFMNTSHAASVWLRILKHNKHHEECVNFIESFVIYYYHVFRARNRMDVAVAFAGLLKHRIRGSLLVSEGMISLVCKVEEIFGFYIQSDEESDCMEMIRDILNKYDLIKNSIMYKKIYKLFMYLLSLSVFDKLGITMDRCNYTYLEQEAIKRRYHLGPDFVHSLLDTLVFIYTRGVQCMKLGRIDPLYHDELMYSSWALKVGELKGKSHHLGNPEPHGFTLYEYLADVKHCLEQGHVMYKAVQDDKSAKPFVRKLVSELEIMHGNAISRRESQRSREAPFAVLLHGGSSIAKSTLTKLLFNYYGELHSLPTDDEFLYSRNPADEYWTNFNTTQWCVLMDDIAYLNPNKTTSVDKTLNEIIQVVNSTPFVPTQAALEDKGRTPMRAKLVLATTNTKDLKASTYFSCPLAIQRRLPYVVSVKPKEEYLVHGCMLDGGKVPPIDGVSYPNYWDFMIYKVVPHELNQDGGTQYAQHELLHEFDDINNFLAWFGKTTHDFLEIQKKELKCKDLMSKIKVCKECYKPEAVCSCLDVQSSDQLDTVEYSEQMRQEVRTIENKGWVHRIQEFLIKCVIFFAFKLSYFNQGLFNWFLYLSIKPLLADYPGALAYFAETIGYRQRMRLGGKSSDFIKIFLGVGATLAAGGFMYKFLFKKDEPIVTPQGSVATKPQESVGSKPQKDIDEVVNVWYKDDYKVTSLDISRSTCSMKGLGFDKVAQLLHENCVTFISETDDYPDKRWVTRGFCVGGQYYLANNHGIPSYPAHRLRVICSNENSGVREQYNIKLSSSMIYRWPERDLCLVWLPQCRPRRNYKSLFCQEGLKGVHQGYLLDRDRTGELRTNRILNVRRESMLIKDLNVKGEVWVMRSQKDTDRGDCGSICLSFDNCGPIILGIHVAKSEQNLRYSLRVTENDIDNMLSKFPVPMVQSGDVNYTSESVPQQLGPLNTKAEVRFIPDGNAIVYGSFNGHRTKPKSHVEPSPLSYVLTDYGYKLTHGKPVMRGWEPWYNNLLPSLDSGTHIEVDTIMKCADSFAEDIVKGLDDEAKAKLIEYDDFTVTNGAAGVRFVDKINRNTSAGFPFNKSKKHFINNIQPQHELQDPVEFDDEIMARVSKCADKYDNLTQYHPIYMASLKDEPRSFKKIKEKNTRVFTGGPVEHIFVTRRELLSYTKVMQENKFVSECAAGTIAQSVEWDHIYKYLTHFGEDRIFDGDHSKFDKSMEAVAILAVFRVITQVLEKCGASQEHINRCWCIGYDLAFAFINFNGTLIQMCKGHVSGEALTVLVNSHCNSLYLRYAYSKVHPMKICSDFKKNITLMTYGDDFVGGVNPYCGFFNFRVLKGELAKIGLKITPADKEAGDYDLMNIQKINFLKRNFRFEHEFQRYVCPLDVESIRKSLMVNVKSKTIPEEMQSAQCIGSAVREYFWYGRETFEKERSFLQHIVSLTPEVEVYVDGSTFPTWRELHNQYNDISKSIREFNVDYHLSLYR